MIIKFTPANIRKWVHSWNKMWWNDKFYEFSSKSLGHFISSFQCFWVHVYGKFKVKHTEIGLFFIKKNQINLCKVILQIEVVEHLSLVIFSCSFVFKMMQTVLWCYKDPLYSLLWLLTKSMQRWMIVNQHNEYNQALWHDNIVWCLFKDKQTSRSHRLKPLLG